MGGIRLTVGRAREIAGLFTDSRGGSFACHKTVDYVDEDADERPMRDGEQICAGGLIFAEKQGAANQFVRIMERLGAYDARELRGHEHVFDSLREMVAAQRTNRPSQATTQEP